MNQPDDRRRRGRRVTHFVVALALVMLAGTIFWSSRIRMASEAAQFQPATNRSVWVPAGTAIEAVITNRIASSSESGDRVTAFVSTPVAFNARLAIPAGATLKGNLENLSVIDSEARALVKFTGLVIDRRSFAIQTYPVAVSFPIQSDIEIAGTALRTLMGATVGAAVGAASGDAGLVNRGFLEGAKSASPANTAVPLTVTLLIDLKL